MPDVLTAAVIAALALVVVWNAFRYRPSPGTDAELDAIEYARTLVTDWRIPTELANYYTPPGYFILAGPLIELGDLVRVSDAGDLARPSSGALTVGTAMLLAILSGSLFTGRAWLRFAAVAFFAACPAVVKTAAMVHPQPLAHVSLHARTRTD